MLCPAPRAWYASASAQQCSTPQGDEAALPMTRFQCLQGCLTASGWLALCACCRCPPAPPEFLDFGLLRAQ